MHTPTPMQSVIRQPLLCACHHPNFQPLPLPPCYCRSALQGLQSALAADAACSDPAIASAAGRVQLQAVSRQPSSSAAQALVQATQGWVACCAGEMRIGLVCFNKPGKCL